MHETSRGPAQQQGADPQNGRELLPSPAVVGVEAHDPSQLVSRQYVSVLNPSLERDTAADIDGRPVVLGGFVLEADPPAFHAGHMSLHGEPEPVHRDAGGEIPSRAPESMIATLSTSGERTRA